MSVNLKVDGQTYENANSIKVGGKTIAIEEISGSGVMSGSFVAVNGQNTFELPTANFTHLLISPKVLHGDITGKGKRVVYSIQYEKREDNYFYANIVATNSAGSTMVPSLKIDTNAPSALVYVNGTTVTTSKTTVGTYLEGIEYFWYIW